MLAIGYAQGNFKYGACVFREVSLECSLSASENFGLEGGYAFYVSCWFLLAIMMMRCHGYVMIDGSMNLVGYR